MEPIQAHKPFRVAKRREATGRPYAPDTSSAGRVALPRRVREEAPREAALTLPGAPGEVKGGGLGPSSRGVPARSGPPPEVLVVVVVLVVKPVLPIALPARLAKGQAAAMVKEDARVLLLPPPS